MVFTIIGFDIEGYSKSKTTGDMRRCRSVLEEIVSTAKTNSGLDKLVSKHIEIVDTGDGFFIFIDSRNYSIILQFAYQMEIIAKNMAKIRFRVAIHQGECEKTVKLFSASSSSEGSDNNMIGDGFNETARFLDSDPLRNALKLKKSEYFVFGISKTIMLEIENQPFFDKGRFFEYAVSVKDFNDSISIHSLDPILPDDQRIQSTNALSISESFQNFLNENPILELSSFNNYKEKDIYVFPDLTKDFDHKLGTDKIKSENFLANFCVDPKNTIISGDEQIGKTQFCKKSYKTFFEDGNLLPIYLNFGNIYSGNIKNKIDKALSSQYVAIKQNTEYYKKIIIIDDFHLIPAKYQQKIIDELKAMKQTFCFLIVDSVYNINLLERDLIQYFDLLCISELCPSLRSELIDKWMEGEGIVDENYKKSDGLKDYVNTTLMKGLVPSTPFNVLVILAESRAYNPLNSEVTSKGHCYQTLIYISLKKAGVEESELDIYINILEYVAYNIYRKKKETITEKKLYSFLAEYGDLYNQPILVDELLSKLNLSRIFYRSSIGEYSFNCKYIYYFFIAQYFANHKNEKLISDLIAEIYNNLEINENGYIGVFLIHHIKDESVLEEIQLNLMVLYDKFKEVALDKEEVEFLEKHLSFMSALTLGATNRAAEKRQKKLEMEDEEEEHSKKEIDNNEEFQVNLEFSKLRKALKTVDVMGQILKTRTGSFKKEKQKEYFHESLNVYLRISRRFLEDFKNNESEFIEYFEDRIKNFNSRKLDKEQRYEIASQYFFNFNFLNYHSPIRRASATLCSDKLVGIVKEVCEEIGSPMADLVYLQCYMWYKKSIPVDEIIEKSNDMPGLCRSLLHVLVKNYCEYHKIDYKDRQRISTKFNIKLENPQITTK